MYRFRPFLTAISALVAALIGVSTPSLSAQTVACPRPIRLGCTYGCDSTITAPVLRAAKKAGYQVRFFNLFKMKANSKEPARLLDQVDAVLSPGGKDIDPKFYIDAVPETERAALLDRFKKKGKPGSSDARDGFELALLAAYLEDSTGKPWLGICYGAQLLGVGAGIPLIVDIRTELGIPNRYQVKDRIDVEEGSLAREIFGDEPFTAQEAHHQALNPRDELPAISEGRARITGHSNDGKLAEIIEYPGLPVIGVQFHPELSDPAVGDAVFGWFLESACRNQ